MWSDSQTILQSLLDHPSSKSFVKVWKRQCAKLSSGVAMIVGGALIWGDYPPINHFVDPKWFKGGLHGKEPFYIGAILMLYSFWFSSIGMSVLGNSLFKIPTPIRLATAASLRGNEDGADDEGSKRNSTIIIVFRMFFAVIMMIALLIATNSGIKLIVRPISENGLYTLTISVGLATVVFSLIYFMIGVLIMIELAEGLGLGLASSKKLKLREEHSGSSTTNSV